MEVVPADLSDPETVETLWRKVALRRHIEIVVNKRAVVPRFAQRALVPKVSAPFME